MLYEAACNNFWKKIFLKNIVSVCYSFFLKEGYTKKNLKINSNDKILTLTFQKIFFLKGRRKSIPYMKKTTLSALMG